MARKLPWSSCGGTARSREGREMVGGRSGDGQRTVGRWSGDGQMLVGGRSGDGRPEDCLMLCLFFAGVAFQVNRGHNERPEEQSWEMCVSDWLVAKS